MAIILSSQLPVGDHAGDQEISALQEAVKGLLDAAGTGATHIARYNAGTLAQPIPQTTFTVIQFNVVESDPEGLVTTGAAWHYTAPESGLYMVNAAAILMLAVGVTTDSLCSVYVNGVEARRANRVAQTGDGSLVLTNGFSFSAHIAVSAGDSIDVRMYQASTTAPAKNIEAYTPSNWISIYRVSA